VRPAGSGRGVSGPGLTRLAVGRLGGPLLVAGIIALAFNLRASISGLPPVFPELAAQLRLSASALALLAAVPVLCFGVFSGVAAPLSRRFGEERVLGAAVALVAAGLLARGALPDAMLFPGTVAAGAGIALLNVLLPSLVKRRKPDRAGLLIGLYLLALAAGAILASLIAVPVFRAAGGADLAVRLLLGMWALPALLAACCWLPQLRFRRVPATGPGNGAVPRRAGTGVMAMSRHALAWQVMLFMGLQSLSYYATLSWFPTMFRDRGASAVHAGDLLALMNLGNAVTALLIPVLAHRARDQRALVAVVTLVTAVGVAGAIFGPLDTAAGWVLLLGLGQGSTLGLGIFFTMARARDPVVAASLSSFAQGAGYLLASAGPVAVGLLHAATGGWTVPAGLLLVVAVLQLVTGWLAGRDRMVPVAGGGG
jgi:MFS transporter, CP family, cyanate transporter